MADARRLLPSLLLALLLSSSPGKAQEPLPSMPPEEEGAVQEPPAAPVTPEAAGTNAPLEGGTDAPVVPPGQTPPGQAPPASGAKPAPAPGKPGQPAAPAAPAAPPVDPDAITFDLKFPAEQGGGSASGSALDLEYKRDDYAVLTGKVRIHYQDVDLQADRAEMDLNTKIVTATGNVILDQGPRRLTGVTAEFDLDTKTGTLSEATAQVSPDYYFNGEEIAKIDDDVYTVTNGTFTSCSQKVPDWSFRLGTARVEVDEYAHIRNASMRAKKLPVFYTPYILWPVKRDRASGLLIPNIGYSDRRGAALGLAYYQVLGRSYDTTFHVDLFGREYLGLGNELRYAPSEGTRGNLIAYTIRDPLAKTFDQEEWRWKVEWNHVTNDLPLGMRGVVNYQDFSDFNFFRDFERDFDRNSLRFLDSRAFVTGNWGPHLLNFLLNDRQTFVNFDDIVDQRKLPELEYRLRSTRLGRTPLYLQFQGSASYLDLSRPESYSGTYGRVDAFPQLTLPIRSFPWLNLSVTGGGRLTYYTDSVNGSATPPPTDFTGESLSRIVPSASAQIVGPSFSRVFDWKAGDYARFKHVIEPRFTYNFLDEIDEEDRGRFPLFDEVDALGSGNSGRVALINRVLAKPEGTRANATEIFLFELSRRYSFDENQPLIVTATDRSTAGPLEALLRFNPSNVTSLKLEADYDTLSKGLQSTGLSGSYGSRKGDFVGLTWYTRYAPESGDKTSDQIRLFGGVTIWPRRLRLETQINYDVQESFLQSQRYILDWTQQCYSLRLELRDFHAGEGPRTSDKDFRFSLSLKNVGTFLDLTSRSSSNAEP
ncbi:MAG TPA: LPS assembly protein LptD [Thermoanaerobaculia bacterium]|nr:LPS assembly protein LptD [Thermoanaerobaculia bacterium]